MNTCPCGEKLHYADHDDEAVVRLMVLQFGPDVKMVSLATGRAWMVPRHYVALHGIKERELPALAAQHEWMETAR